MFKLVFKRGVSNQYFNICMIRMLSLVKNYSTVWELKIVTNWKSIHVVN